MSLSFSPFPCQYPPPAPFHCKLFSFLHPRKHALQAKEQYPPRRFLQRALLQSSQCHPQSVERNGKIGWGCGKWDQQIIVYGMAETRGFKERLKWQAGVDFKWQAGKMQDHRHKQRNGVASTIQICFLSIQTEEGKCVHRMRENIGVGTQSKVGTILPRLEAPTIEEVMHWFPIIENLWGGGGWLRYFLGAWTSTRAPHHSRKCASNMHSTNEHIESLCERLKR